MIEIELQAAPGLTLSASLFAVNSDVVIANATSVIEQANSKGAYIATFNPVAQAAYLVVGYDTTGPTAIAAAYTYVNASSGRFRSGFYADVVCAAQAALMEVVARNKTVTSQADGNLKVYDIDGVTELLVAPLFEDLAESQPYRGRGAEVRGKLAPP